ncbi:MAG: adenylate/guanylate cyclase domain-containing protein [Planctomycetes bacterium]|nr:adenylate/guanylate cyclase domain-containing protein [Planctomycetota bacterium]
MQKPNASYVVSPRDASRSGARAVFAALAKRFPILGLFGAIFLSNIAGSFFNFNYNKLLIVSNLHENQQDAFWLIAAPIYNVLAYGLCLCLMLYLIWPIRPCLRNLRTGKTVDPNLLRFCQRRLINLPIIQLIVNTLGWAPGAVFFPWIVLGFGGPDSPKSAQWIWSQFAVSFLVSTVFTTVQTFFILQSFLTAYLYPEFFKDTRPEDVPGAISVPFTARLLMMWFAVAVMPLIALLAVTLNFMSDTQWFAIGLVAISAVSGGGIFRLVGRDLWRWMHLQTVATGAIAGGDFAIRIDDPRPDEWGRLTNHFNDMASSLSQAWESHETLGQLVSPEVRDQILRQMTGFEVRLQEITVVFVDIRGFTPRCAGAAPERIGALLNRFLTLTLQSIEGKGGYVNKFLGDGVMALFGATHQQDDHADLALASARELLTRLCALNADLALQGEAPLIVGIGIHTGPALVGCFGATVQGTNGKPLMRREFTAIGETVNLGQRIEQLTKKCGGPILLTEGTRARMSAEWVLDCLGPQDLPGAPEPIVVYKAAAG